MLTELEKQLVEALEEAEKDLRKFGGTSNNRGGVIPVPGITARRWFPYIYSALEAAEQKEASHEQD